MTVIKNYIMNQSITKGNAGQGLVFTKEQQELIKRQIAPEATVDELAIFMHVAKKVGLDPFAKQIYCIHRNTRNSNGSYSKKMTIQTSIDGFRVIAERSGNYAGQGEPIYVEDKDGNIVLAKVSVYKFDRRGSRYEAAIGVAYWSEYVQTDREGKPISMWAKMPRVMIAKVAEALALRKAYPQDLSSLYTTDEMGQADFSTQYVTTEKSAEELHAEFLVLLNEYKGLSPMNDKGEPEDLDRYHPDQWKESLRTRENYVIAIDRIKDRIAAYKESVK